MNTPTLESQLLGTINYLNPTQKMDVLLFIKEKLGVQHKSIVRRKALRDIRTALKGNVAF